MILYARGPNLIVWITPPRARGVILTIGCLDAFDLCSIDKKRSPWHGSVFPLQPDALAANGEGVEECR